MIVDRTKRVKEARDEAKKEIDDYKKQKDDEFKKFESEVRLPSSPPRLCPLGIGIGCGDLNAVADGMIIAHQRQQESRRGCKQGRRGQDKGDQGGGQEGPGPSCERSTKGGL